MDTSKEPRLYRSLEGIIKAVTGLYLHRPSVEALQTRGEAEAPTRHPKCQATHRARAGFQVIQTRDSHTNPVPKVSLLSFPSPHFILHQNSHQTHQKGLLGLVGAFNAFGIELALLQAALHDVYSTGHPSLEVLEGRGWKALLQFVA